MTSDTGHGEPARGVVQDLGWGRLVFGQTFDDPDQFGTALRAEASGRRDIGMYLDAPHVFVALHPQEFFIDPSFTYRLQFDEARRVPAVGRCPGCRCARWTPSTTARAINQIYLQCRMVPADVDLMWDNSRSEPHMVYLVATDDETGAVVGTVTGIDHAQLFDDEENGSSLWCLAVDPTLSRPGVGGLLVRSLVEEFIRRGRSQMDLSVLHDNEGAIALYERMGFVRVPVLGIKRKNAINEKLFAPVHDRRGARRAEPVRAHHRRRGDHAGYRRRGPRRQGRLSAPHPRRHHRGHPGVAVRADQRRRHEPLRRQARSPKSGRRGRNPGAEGPERPPSPTRTTSSSPRWARWWSSRPAVSRAPASPSA